MADKTWDLVHDRADENPVKRRVVECHEALARLSARGGALNSSVLGRLTNLPELFDSRVKARSLAYLFAAGAGLGLLVLALPHPQGVRDLQLCVLAGLAIATAGLIYLQADRVVEWQLHFLIAAGTTMLSLANYYTGTSTLYPVLYSWTAVYAFYFFSLRAALAHMAYIGVAYAVVLANQDPVSPAIRWLLAVATPLIVGLLISRMIDAYAAPAPSPTIARRSSSRARRAPGWCSTAPRMRSSLSIGTGSSAPGTLRPSGCWAGRRPRRSASPCAP